MRIIELFAGIGACSKALENIGVDLEIVDAVEIDKYAIKSFNAIHNTNFETRDISKYNVFHNNIDIITHGSPCQDFSIAGKQEGGDQGSGTRSSLMYETIRIVEQIKPKYILWENIKNLLSKKHKHNFDNYINTLDLLGYNNYYQVLNAKDYGIPQNRERVFTVSIRKDIDKGNFMFPEKEELKIRLKDMLEDNPDEKYYIKDGILNNILSSNQAGFLSGGKWDKINESCRRYYKEDGISPTITTCQGGNTEPKIMTSKQKEIKVEVIGNYMPSNHNASRIVNNMGLAPTVKENHGTGTATNSNYRIRKLTPKECWRLMGFNDEDFEKAKNIPTSNTQLYKQAGNSIVVKVLERIFNNLFINQENTNNKTKKTTSDDTIHIGTSFNELLNNITLGDSYELIKQIPDKSIDLVIMDPPYEFDTGSGAGAFGTKRRNYRKEYISLYHEKGKSTKDTERLRISANKERQRQQLNHISNGFELELLDELVRVMKKINIYIWCSKKQVSKILNYFENINCSTDILTWHKTNPTPTINNSYLPDTEYCIYARENGAFLGGEYETKHKFYVTTANKNDKDKFKHPTIKPINIIKNLIINSSKENEIIFDPFSGSGTTCVAAKELNRQYIGIEIDPEYHKISVDRLEGILANGQTSMFIS